MHHLLSCVSIRRSKLSNIGLPGTAALNGYCVAARTISRSNLLCGESICVGFSGRGKNSPMIFSRLLGGGCVDIVRLRSRGKPVFRSTKYLNECNGQWRIHYSVEIQFPHPPTLFTFMLLVDNVMHYNESDSC